MSPDLLLIPLLNGLSHGLLLFLLASGLTLIFSMLGVLNFAHASFYLLGAYLGFQFSHWWGYWWALALAPLTVGLLGAAVERWGLRRVHRSGPIAELLFTFGLSFVIVELVRMIWGPAPVTYRVPAALDGPLPWLLAQGIVFPSYRAFAMGVSIAVLAALWLALQRTRLGLVIRAALTHPRQVEALGHDLPGVFVLVFGGGCALAGLAGVIGGNLYVTEPGMALHLGAMMFVAIVIGGLGSLAGALIASLAIGLVDALGKSRNESLLDLLRWLEVPVDPQTFGYGALSLTVAQLAPLLPFLLLVAVLIVRPRGLLGQRED